MSDQSVTVKGSPVRSLQRFIDSELTPEQREAVLRAVLAEFAERLRRPILPTETIPVHSLNQLTEEAAKVKRAVELGSAVEGLADVACALQSWRVPA